jgi:hypothetical protein
MRLWRKLFGYWAISDELETAVEVNRKNHHVCLKSQAEAHTPDPGNYSQSKDRNRFAL